MSLIHPSVIELFKYERKIEWAIDILKEGMLYSSNAASFNDPFDGAIPLQVDHEPPEYIASVVREMLKKRNGADVIVDSIKSVLNPDGSLDATTCKRITDQADNFIKSNANLGIVCLSEDPVSVLMWSHYGDKHTGICLGFWRNGDAANLLGDADVCAPIKYSDEYPKPVFSELYKADGTVSEKLLLTKAREWAYEREWRLMTDESNRKVKIPAPFSQVIVGCKTPDATIELCRTEALRLKIPLRRAKKVAGMFALELEDLI